MLYPELTQEISCMCQADQEMRKRNNREPEYWEEGLDQKHTIRMKEIVTQIGWPNASKVGYEAADYAELLVRHADHDVEFQIKCLALMKSEPDHEIDKINIAYLEDRVRVNSKQPQLYGTQFIDEGGKFTPREIENPEQVDERRKYMGLPTLEEGMAQMYKKYPRVS